MSVVVVVIVLDHLRFHPRHENEDAASPPRACPPACLPGSRALPASASSCGCTPRPAAARTPPAWPTPPPARCLRSESSDDPARDEGSVVARHCHSLSIDPSVGFEWTHSCTRLSQFLYLIQVELWISHNRRSFSRKGESISHSFFALCPCRLSPPCSFHGRSQCRRTRPTTARTTMSFTEGAGESRGAVALP